MGLWIGKGEDPRFSEWLAQQRASLGVVSHQAEWLASEAWDAALALARTELANAGLKDYKTHKIIQRCET